jgi:hypothetical protein
LVVSDRQQVREYRVMAIRLMKDACNRAIRAVKNQYDVRIAPAVRPMVVPRRAQFYCIGTAKSGTHSIAGLFHHGVRAAHEPEAHEVIRAILDVAAGKMSDRQLRSYVRKRDRRLWLEVDSSQLNYFILDTLREEFPRARFLLTIRNCYAFVDSVLNDTLRRPDTPEWKRLKDHRYRPALFTHPPEEQLLKERGLYTLDGYLSYWAAHNEKVLASVPAERLLVVRTDRITPEAGNICAFAGLPPESVDLGHSHEFKNPNKFGLLSQIDRGHLERTVDKYCRPLLGRFFPEVKSLDDSGVR